MNKTKIEIIEDNFFLIVFLFIGIFLYVMSLHYIQNEGEIKDFINVFLAVLALNIAFSSICFSYSSLLERDEKNQLIKIAKNFLLASVLIISGIVFVYLLVFVSKTNHTGFLGGLSVISVAVVNSVVVAAIFLMSKSFNEIIKFLLK